MKKLSLLLSALTLCGLSVLAQTAPPAVSGLSVSVGIPGSSVTISGTGFNTTASSNIVYFGATRATVTSASSTSLTVTVPFGASYAPVSVNNTSTGLTGFSQVLFLPSFNNGGYVPSINFGTNAEMNSGEFYDGGGYVTGYENLIKIVTGDIDGDGKPDVVGISSTPWEPTSSRIMVYRNISSPGGTFKRADPLRLQLNTAITDIVLADIDGDSKLDIVVERGDTLSVLLNTSASGALDSSSIAAPVNFNNPTAGALAVGDLDLDGKVDIVTATTTMSVFNNNSTPGSIALSSPFSMNVGATAGTRQLVIGDLTGDGKPEILTASKDTYGGGPGLIISRNVYGGGTLDSASFAAAISYDYSESPFLNGANSIVLADLDQDGKLDIVCRVSNYDLYAIRNNTIGGVINATSFTSPVTLTAGSVTGDLHSFAVGDMDGDGKPDVVGWFRFGDNFPSHLGIFKNTHTVGGPMSFAPRMGFFAENLGQHSYSSWAESISGLTIDDMDGDARPDAVFTGQYWFGFEVIQNQPPPPAITALSSTTGKPGTTLTITGQNFSANPADNIVFFGDTRASVLSGGSTSLTVGIPFGATCGPVSVNNTVSDRTGSSGKFFSPSFDNSAFPTGTVNFDPKVEFAGDTMNFIMRSGDVDGDGKVDILISKADSIYIYRNISTPGLVTTSSFAAPVKLKAVPSIPTYKLQFEIGDIDNDGKKDIVCSYGSGFSVLRNVSSPGTLNTSSFQPHIDISSGLYATTEKLWLADVDEDGKLDVIGISNNAMGSGVAVYHNLSSPGTIDQRSFDAPVGFGLDFGWTALAYDPLLGTSIKFADLTGDRKPEMICLTGYPWAATYIKIMKDTAFRGSITSASSIASISYASRYSYHDSASINLDSSYVDLAVGDVDGDGKQDLVARMQTGTISVMRNISTGVPMRFAAPVNLHAPVIVDSLTLPDAPTDGFYIRVALGDFDGDGKLDIVATNPQDSTVSVFRNTCTPGSITTSSFAARQDFNVGIFPLDMIITDIDGDGKSDVVTSSVYPNSYYGTNGPNNTAFTILRNNPGNAISGIMELCSGSTTTLNYPVGGGTWSSTNTAVATIGSATGAWTAVAAGTATISYAYAGGSTSVVVTVDAMPGTATITGSVSICEGASVTLTGTPAGGTWSSSQLPVAAVTSPGVVSAYGSGTAIISYVISNVCGNSTATTVATVNPLPVAGDITGLTNVCVSNTATLMCATAGGVWTSSNPSVASIGTTGIYSGVSTGLATISYTVTNGCGSVTKTRDVVVISPAGAPIVGDPHFCAGVTTTFTCLAPGGTWSSANPSLVSLTSALDNVAAFTGWIPGGPPTTVISYTSTNCGATVTATLSVTTSMMSVRDPRMVQEAYVRVILL